MDRIFVVRHGETTANEEGINAGPLDYPLSRKGKKQIAFLAKALSKIKISAVYSSPVFRAVETAKLLAHPHQLDVKIVKDLTEVKLKPEFIGKEGRKHILTDPESYEETYQELQQRVVGALDEIEKESSGNVIAVSHGDPIAALLNYVVERDTTGKNYYVIHPDPGSLSVIEDKGAPRRRLVLFNYRKALFENY